MSAPLTAADAAVFETFAVPRYLSLFGELALEMLLAGESLRMVHVGCRTGYPDLLVCQRHPGAQLVSYDASRAAIELAQVKADELPEGTLTYQDGGSLPVDLADAQFSHAMCLHPSLPRDVRSELFQHMVRVLYSGGQALVAMPLRGSFQELGDLFREFALKYNHGELTRAVDHAMSSFPNIEQLAEELEDVGFSDVDVEIRQTTLNFESGRAFAEDPVTRLLIVPELQTGFGELEIEDALNYSYDAIDKYWSEAKFELSVAVGCASARVG